VQNVPPIYLLQTLIAFADHENLVLAAERLGLTQPTVSRQLQQLEELFPQSLFTTQGRNKVLTDYGLALVAELRPRFSDLERVFQKVDQSFSNEKEITLRIGGSKEVLSKYFADITFEGTLEVTPMDPEEVSTQIQEMSLDIAISTTEIASALWTSKKLFTETPVLIIPNRWGTNIESAKDWAQIATQHPACSFSKSLPLLGDYLEKHKLDSQINYLTNDWFSLEERVHKQKSWSIIPSTFAKDQRGYKIYQIQGSSNSAPHFLYYRKDLAKHAWMKSIIDQAMR
jgi:DNA-binding transcriptional LysR family regulator